MSGREPEQPVDEAPGVEAPSAPAGERTAPSDRRRPGRVEYTNRPLVGLLRVPATLKAAQTEAGRDDLAPAKGIIIGVLLTTVFWAAVAALSWFFLRH